MKISLIFSALVVFVSIVACQNTTIDQGHLDKIASDVDYDLYRTLTLEQAGNIAIRAYDLASIGDWIRLGYDLCEAKDDEISSIRGALEYRRLNCAIEHQAEIVAQKFPGMRDLSATEHEYIRLKYREITDSREFKKLVEKRINNN